MELVLISIYLFSIIFLICFAITNFLKLIKKDTLYSRALTAFSAIAIFLVSIPELILHILTGKEYRIIIIAQLVIFAIFSIFHIILVYREIRKIRAQTHYFSNKIDKKKVKR